MATASESHARTAINTMRSYCTRIKAIQNLIGEKRRITQEEKQHLQQLLTSLKSDLKTEVDRSSTIRGEAELNDIEKAYLMPALRQASCRIRVKTNSHPINSNWHDDLYSAHLDIDHLLRQLIRQYPES